MKNRLYALIVAMMLAIGVGVATPASAARIGDCTAGSPNWLGWEWPSSGANYGAGNTCGQPWNPSFGYKVKAWDGSSNGYCVTIFRGSTLAGAWTAIPNTTACGVDVVATSAVEYVDTAKLRVQEHTAGGTWTANGHNIWICDSSAGQC